MVSSLRPHVPPEASPDVVLQLLELLSAGSGEFSTIKELRYFSAEGGLSDRQEIPIFMTSSGLLERRVDGNISLSQTARLLLQVEANVRADVLHFLIYSGWSEDKPSERSELWGYRQVCDLLWERAPVDVLAATDQLTEEIRNNALLQFGDDVSFSPKSIRGVRKWLEAVTPPVLEQNLFRRRQYAHPPLLLLALGLVAKQSDGEIGIDLLLTPERREAVCQSCLLELSALDQAIDWMLPLYSHVVELGTTAGIYGRFLRFHKWPGLHDIAPRR